ncbi:hypothetical protein RV18_GL000795 [Enterococcus termitis]|nr:hypothetical protein RV18_GL000795 [Enterococcus termitis]
MSSFSLLYSLGVFLGWDFVEISGEIDIITFCTVMWSLLMMLGIPLIMFSYLAASTAGGEIQDGQILFEISHSKSRKKLMIGKFSAIVTIILVCYILNFILSSIFYILFMARSSVGNTDFFSFESYHGILLLKSFAGILLLIFLSAMAFAFSINFGVFRSIVFALVVYVVLKMLMYIHSINVFVPGYLTLFDKADFSMPTLIYQSIFLIFLTIAVIAVTLKNFNHKDF